MCVGVPYPNNASSTIAFLSMASAIARRTRESSSGLCAAFMMMPSQVEVGTESITMFGFFLN